MEEESFLLIDNSELGWLDFSEVSVSNQLSEQVMSLPLWVPLFPPVQPGYIRMDLRFSSMIGFPHHWRKC